MVEDRLFKPFKKKKFSSDGRESKGLFGN